MRRRSRLYRSAALAAATATLAGGAGAVLAGTVGRASAASTPQVAAYALPSGSYANAELPAVAAPNGSGEWFLASGTSTATLMEEPTGGGTPTVVTSNVDDNSGKSAYLTLVTANGYTWANAPDYTTTGFQSNGTVVNVPLAKAFTFDARDMTSDAGGNLYIPDHGKSEIAQALIDVSDLLKSTGNLWTIPSTFSSTAPDAVAIAGGLLWFTTDSGQLGSINPSNANSSVQGPYSAQVDGFGHTLTAGADGDLWAVGSGGGDIVRVVPQCGAVAATYSAGLPSSPVISSITAGSDGNIWFTESGANQIGELDVNSGAISSYPLPSGYQLTGPGAQMIAPGPSGSGTLFFSAQTTAGSAAIGEVTGLATSSSTAPASTQACSSQTGTTTTTGTTTPTTTTPTTTTPTTTTTTAITARATVATSAKLSAKGIAEVKVTCKGSGVCRGRLLLRETRTIKVKVHGKTRKKKSTATIGSAKYRVRAGRSADVAIKLGKGEYTAVAAAVRRTLKVTAVLEPSTGKSHSSTLRLLAPAPKHAKKKR